MKTYDVTYLVLSGIDGYDEVMAEGTVTLAAKNKKDATLAAETWAHDNDPHCDSRIDPLVRVTDVQPAECAECGELISRDGDVPLFFHKDTREELCEASDGFATPRGSEA